VKIVRHCLAALVLSFWLLAVGHVALEHCAAMNGACAVACAPGEESHHSDESDREDRHHHHFVAWAVQLVKVVDGKALTPVWMPLDDSLAERLTALLREMNAAGETRNSWESPPDERAAGWLLVCRTAQPVRGPSLAV
jgi:hypothetical protein